MKKNKNKTYQRLIRNLVLEINQLRPDSDEKLRSRLNKKFEKYMDRLQKNGPTGNTNN